MAKPIAQFFLPTYCQQILSFFPHALALFWPPHCAQYMHVMHHFILLQTNIWSERPAWENCSPINPRLFAAVFPVSFERRLLSPYFSFFAAFRCIASVCKTNSEDIVKMDSSKFGKLSAGLIVNLRFCAMQGFPGIRPCLSFLNPNGVLMHPSNLWPRCCQPKNHVNF